MKQLKQLSMALVLTLMLGASAFAGDIDVPKAPSPPSASSAPGQTDTPPGEIQVPGETQGPNLASYSVTEAALNLLQSALSVF